MPSKRLDDIDTNGTTIAFDGIADLSTMSFMDLVDAEDISIWVMSDNEALCSALTAVVAVGFLCRRCIELVYTAPCCPWDKVSAEWKTYIVVPTPCFCCEVYILGPSVPGDFYLSRFLSILIHLSVSCSHFLDMQ